MAATVTATHMGGGAQTIEQFVGNALDDAKISPLHRQSCRAHRRRLFLRRHRLHGLRLAGSVPPAVQVCDRTRSCGHRQRHRVRPVHRHRRPGRVLRPVRPPLHLPVQPAPVRRLHPPRRVRSERDHADYLPLHRRRRAWAPSNRCASSMPANIRPSASAAASWRSFISSAAPACGRSAPRWCCFSAVPCRYPKTSGAASG